MKTIARERNFFNGNGRMFAQIGPGGVLRKSEKERDRLRIFGGRSHAIDEELTNECSRLGVEELQIREKADGGGVRVWRISLEDVRQYGKIRTLRGVLRRTIPLVRCELVSGPVEDWYTAERAAMMKPEAEIKSTLREQGQLFPQGGTSAWDRRAKYEL